MAGLDYPWPDPQLEPVCLAPFKAEPFVSGAPWASHPGWVQFASEVRLSEACIGGSGTGALLTAEWVEEDGAMHRIYADPSGGGGLVHLGVCEAAAGEQWLRQKIRVLGSDKGSGRRLLYHVYWTTGASDGAIERAFDMFAEFEGGA